jgi:hypothetical protein
MNKFDSMQYSWKELIWIVLSACLLVALLEYFKSDSTISGFLFVYKNQLIAFLVIFILLAFTSAIIYQRSLDDVDEETETTVKSSIVNVILWSGFWIGWCIFNVIAILHYSITIKLFIFSFLLTNVPGISVFIFTLSTRRDQLKSRQSTSTRVPAIKGFNQSKNSLLVRYHSGFYGILTTPVYLLGLLVNLLM